MNFYNIFKKFICFILLYTIFVLNASEFYIFANEINTNIEQNEEYTQNETQSLDEQTETTTQIVNDPLNLTADSAVLIDAKTGIVLYDKNKDEKAYPASTTKILTALLALEKGNLKDVITHSHNAVYNIEPGSSHIGMREDEQLTMEQALHGILLASANEVSMAVAEHISGTVENFVDLMNERAKEIGAKNTHFANPHGFHNDDHYTTAYDMALIMQQAITNEEFLRFISTTKYEIPPTNIVNETRYLHNSNKLILKTSPYYYEYCVGGKTGYTDKAGNTLVAYAKKDDIELISVVMKSKGSDSYTDTTAMFEYGFTNYEQKEIFNKEGYKNKASVIQKFNRQEIPLGDIYLVAEDNFSIDLPKTVDVSKIEKVADIPNPLVAPIKVGDKVGTLNFVYNENIIGSVNLLSETKIDKIDEQKLQRKEDLKAFVNITFKIIKYIVIGLIVFVVGFLLLAFISRTIIKNKRKKRRQNRYKTNRKIKPMNNRRNRRR